MGGTEHANPKPKASMGEVAGEKSTSTGAGATLHSDLVALTIDPNNGRIVKVEKVDSIGARGDLSHEDAESLTRGNTTPTLEAILEQVFEAGIGCVLGTEAEQDEGQETEHAAALSHLLLMPLMERTSAHRLLQPEMLGKAIVASAIEQATSYRRGENKVSEPQAERAMGKRRSSTHQDRRTNK